MSDVDHLDFEDLGAQLLHVCVMCGELVIGWCDHGGLVCDECCASLMTYGLHAALPGYEPDARWVRP